MLPFAIATLNGHSNWFKALGLAVPSIAGRREYFESRDEKNRTFTHLAAISGYENLYNISLINSLLSLFLLLLYALRNLEILRLLIKIGCDPNVKDENFK